ncbi:26679_t:CDS:2 [Gigaspora margarita]|uniref:26679_t:CDS:1 n=1 Tax=Gigaspora margarita TaxID=4874 RepID=A0ABN7UVS2_GIGMA|nr:26679_t:CDS:2 [Gigaspora margarita]
MYIDKKERSAKAVTRSAKKKNVQTELGIFEPLTDLPKLKKLQKLYQAKGKDIEEQAYIDEDQQVQNHSSFAINKYQYKVLSQVNLRTAKKQVYINNDQQLRTAILSIQTNEFDIEPLIQCSNSYSEHLSNHEDGDESSDESLDDEIFSLLRQHNLIPLNVQSTNYNNSYSRIQQN